MNDQNAGSKAGAEVESGPGALCAEAQADGVPCTELGRDCECCEKAVRRKPRPKDRSSS
jgi:hypothetical protein